MGIQLEISEIWPWVVCGWSWLVLNQNSIRNRLNLGLGSLWLENLSFYLKFDQKSAKCGPGQAEDENGQLELEFNQKSVKFGPGQSVAGIGQFLI